MTRGPRKLFIIPASTRRRMASLDLRLLILAFYASTITVLGQDGGGSCASPKTEYLEDLTNKVYAMLQVSFLNETVSAVPVKATRQLPVTGPKKPAPKGPKTVSARSKFMVEKTHFQAQLETARNLRRQFSTAPPYFERDVEYYDQVLEEYGEYVAQKESKFDYCKEDGRVRSGNQYLIPVDSGTRANDYEVFPGVGVYRFHTRPLRWEEARRQCESEDAHLLVVNSEEEANVTVKMFARCRHLQDQQLNDYAYVGVRQVQVNGDYQTIQDRNVDVTGYSKWDFGHPDSSPTKNVKCVSISRDGYLVDLDCHLRLAYFCEYEGI